MPSSFPNWGATRRTLARAVASRSRQASFLVVAGGIVMSGAGWRLAQRAELDLIHAQFEAAAENRISAFQREMEAHQDVLAALAADRRAADQPLPTTAAGSPRHWLLLRPGSGSGWRIVETSSAEAARLIAGAGEPVRAAADRAASGSPAAAGPFVSEGRSRFVLAAPVSGGGAVLAAVVDLGRTLESGMAYLKPHGVDVAITAAPDGPPVYFHRSRKHAHAPGVPCRDKLPEPLAYRRPVPVAGQALWMRCTGVPEFVSAAISWWHWLMLACGLLIALLAGLLVWILTARAERVQRMVERRTRALHAANQRLRGEIAVREDAQRSLAAEEERYRDLFHAASDVVFTADLYGHLLSLNRAGRKALGWPEDDTPPGGGLPLPSGLLQGAARDGSAGPLEVEFGAAGGAPIVLELTVSRVDGGIFGIGRDVTGRRRLEAFENGRRQILEIIAQEAPLLEVFGRIVALVESELPGSAACLLIRRGAQLMVESSGAGLPQTAAAALHRAPVEATGRAVSRAAYWGRVAAAPSLADDHAEAEAHSAGFASVWAAPLLAGSGQVTGAVAVYRARPGLPDHYESILLDKAAQLAALALERRGFTERLLHQAHHDYLTGLPNRLLFQDRLEQALAQGSRRKTVTALLYIDLDGFKLVNDTLGHPVGDGLLRKVGARLEARVRKSDTLARMGGDEFTIIANGLESASDSERVASEILAALRSPFEVDGHHLYVSASIGIAVAPRDGNDQAALQRHADAALYCAKRSGKNTYRVFSPESDAGVVGRLGLQTDLHRALEENQFRLYYQPQVDLATGGLLGYEALLRWEHPSLGLISPAKFVPIAEETGLIHDIGEWVLNEACRQLERWSRQGRRIRLAINISAVQFGRQEWEDSVARAIERYGVDPSLLDLEVTESLILQDIDEAAARMNRLRALGVSISIDDFGTGYSSLSYLKNLPVSKLKIDLSFIRDIRAGQPSPAIVRAIIDLATGLGMKVTAEGVETEHQMEVLRTLACTEAQGYFIGRPMPEEEAAEDLFERAAPAVGSPLTQ